MLLFVRRALRCCGRLACLLTALHATAAQVATATIEAAPPGVPLLSTTVDIASKGYVEREFFISGTAATYTAKNTWGKNGVWAATADTTRVPYKTRVLARYPQDPARFNGTVIVEWINVASGVELQAGWYYSHDYFLREGYAYVTVSTIRSSVAALKAANPARYASLSIPTDSAAYDVYSQAAWASKQQGAALLGGLQPTRVLALGASQAAIFLSTYANAIQPLAQVVDGILIEARPYFGIDLKGALNSNLDHSRIRTDLSIPVLQLQGEFDIVTGQGLQFRQPDTAMVHTWEGAGASHEHVAALMSAPSAPGSGMPEVNPPHCLLPYNTLHSEWAANAAMRALDRWARGLGAPKSMPPLATDLLGNALHDLNGNALGGIRLPEIDVPRVTYGISNLPASVAYVNDAAFCLLSGSAVPLGPIKLALMYPTPEVYKARYQQAAQAAVARGTLLQADADLALSQLP